MSRDSEELAEKPFSSEENPLASEMCHHSCQMTDASFFRRKLLLIGIWIVTHLVEVPATLILRLSHTLIEHVERY